MSFVKGTMICRVCGNEYKYYWWYADGKVDKVPSRNEYVVASHNMQGNRYIISATCPCDQVTNIVYYNEDGTLIGE